MDLNILKNTKFLYNCLVLCRRNQRLMYCTAKNANFGYQRVTEEEKAEKVHEVFQNVASKYDVMNNAMSFGIHKLWKDHFVATLCPSYNTKLLDVAGGTGDIAFRFLDTAKRLKMPKPSGDASRIDKCHVTVCDFSQEMLKYGQLKGDNLGYKENITWIHGDAQNLPFASNSFDAYTIAFGIRNVVRIDDALLEAYRVLKPGGRFLCLEFSQVNNSLLSWIYDQYSFHVIPVMGKVIAGDWKSYQYLVESIRKFPAQEEFKEQISMAGFRFVTYENMAFGAVAIHSGFKI